MQFYKKVILTCSLYKGRGQSFSFSSQKGLSISSVKNRRKIYLQVLGREDLTLLEAKTNTKSRFNKIYLSIQLARNLYFQLVFCISSQSSLSKSSYLSIYLSFYLINFLSTYISICLYFYLLIFLSTYLSMYLSIYVSFYLLIFLSTYLSIYLSFYLHIFLCIYLLMFLSTYLSI